MQRLRIFKIVFTISLLCIGLVGFYGNVSADGVANRSLSLYSVKASAITDHMISFNLINANSIGSIKFEYCTSPLQVLACVAPVGLDVSSAALSSQSGETGFVIFSQTNNVVTLGRPPSVVGSQQNSYMLHNVVNPNSIGSFYLRISTFASSDGTGPALDFGGTVGVITQGVTITTEVPPILEFCAGISLPGNCTTASGNFLNLGNFSKVFASKGTSMFGVGTNAAFGYVVTANGHTMTSGNNTIQALPSPTPSRTGQSQFGINLRANSNPSVGADPSGGSGNPTVDYDSPNLFTYNDGQVVASHSTVSDFERYTVSYLVNINNTQPVGVYNTTITYVVTATF